MGDSDIRASESICSASPDMESCRFWWAWQHPISQHQTAIHDVNLNNWSHFSTALQGAPRIASSLTMCNFLLHFFWHCIAVNLIFTAYTFSPIFPNFGSSLPQMEPTRSQVRNQEVHLERALAFKKGANICCSWYVYLLINLHHALCIALLMSNVPDFIIEAGWRFQSGAH